MTLTIQFYHLLSTPLEKALPALMHKALEGQHRVAIHSADAAQRKQISDAMWGQQVFLPHGDAGMDHAADQPILLSDTMARDNGADVLVILDGSDVPETDGFAKVLDVFNGADDAAVSAARERWARYKDAGHRLHYIKQQPGGGWKKEAQA
jgi:DNA polymerase-3 subunit chi